MENKYKQILTKKRSWIPTINFIQNIKYISTFKEDSNNSKHSNNNNIHILIILQKDMAKHPPTIHYVQNQALHSSSVQTESSPKRSPSFLRQHSFITLPQVYSGSMVIKRCNKKKKGRKIRRGRRERKGGREGEREEPLELDSAGEKRK